MKTLSNWLLGGALLASLTWNWTLYQREVTLGPAATAPCCRLEASGTNLAPARKQELAEICTTSCGESDRLERQAEELQAKLLASLAESEVDEAATTRWIAEISALRRRSLSACVRGILGVREVLSSEEVRALLAGCEDGAACDK